MGWRGVMGTGDRAGGQGKALELLAGLRGRQGGLGVLPWLHLPYSILQARQNQLCSPVPQSELGLLSPPIPRMGDRDWVTVPAGCVLELSPATFTRGHPGKTQLRDGAGGTQNQPVVAGLGNLPLGWEQLSQPVSSPSERDAASSVSHRLSGISPVSPPYNFSPAQAG